MAARLDGRIAVAGRGAAQRLLEVPGVASILEDHALDPDALDERELELEVVIELHVAAERLAAVVDRLEGRIVERAGDAQARAQALDLEAADVRDAAQEVALVDRYAAAVARGDQAPLRVELSDERAPQRLVEAQVDLVADEVV